jgi:hypothetical protein
MEYCTAVWAVLSSAAGDTDKWKLLVLALVRRRFHAKAPAAKAAKAAAAQSGEEGDLASGEDSSGDGERILFYLAVRVVCMAAQSGMPLAAPAALALCRLAPLAGGTRDTCALIEHLGADALRTAREAGTITASLGQRVLPALVDAINAFMRNNCGESALPPAPLDALLTAAAQMLDEDLALVQSDADKRGEAAVEEESDQKAKAGKRKASEAPSQAQAGKRKASEAPSQAQAGKRKASEAPSQALMSTISTFLPHNDRGPTGSERRLVQSLAELLIWARTQAAAQTPGWMEALEILLAAEPFANAGATIGVGNDAGTSAGTDVVTNGGAGPAPPAPAPPAGEESEAEACVHKLQTIIRRKRKLLTASSREQGFSLSTLYCLDPSAITLSMLRRGKAGDLTALQRLASKRTDTRLLQLLAKRYLDENKAVPFESITAMQQSWKSALDPKVEAAELDRLERALQRASVNATVAALRRALPTPSAEAAERTVTIAALDGRATNQVAAILVAAAHQATSWMPEEPAEAAEAMEVEAAAIAAAELAGLGATMAVAAAAGEKKGEEAAAAVGASSSGAGPSGLGLPPPPAAGGEGSLPGSGGRDGGGGDSSTPPSAPPPPPPPAASSSSSAHPGDGAARLPPRLLLGEEMVDVSSLAKVVALLDVIFGREEAAVHDGPDEPATTTAVQNLIERHVGPGDTLLLFASADIKLEERVVAKLQDQRSTVHAHIYDDAFARMAREGAKVGDVTITLLWDDYNDLDLHVFTPNGTEIYFGNRDADGGHLDVDMNGMDRSSKEPIENVFFGDADRGIQAMKGKYKVVVENFAYHDRERNSSFAVPFRVVVRKNGEASEYRGETPAGMTRYPVTAVEFEYAGRTAPKREAMLASALSSSNLVAVTASVGTTLDALRGLMSVGAEVAEIERVRALALDEEDQDEPLASSMAVGSEEGEGEGGEEGEDQVGSEVTLGSYLLPVLASRGPELAAGRQPALASRRRFEVTSRDRLFLQLAKLPERFHAEVAGAFGGPTLLELTAAQLAKRLGEASLPASVLREQGYPPHIVEMVKRLMATKGMSSSYSEA